MGSRPAQLIERIRDRLAERALSSAPLWLTPVSPAARASAGALLVGTLTGRLPSEDASALAHTILSEQNRDGSWSNSPGESGDLSLTLEVTHALNTCDVPGASRPLDRAVAWLEVHRHFERPARDTFALLAALTDWAPTRLRRLTFSLLRFLPPTHGAAAPPPSESLALAVNLLGRTKTGAAGRARRLLEMQLPDGSWDGSCRSTVFALIALKHASLSVGDAAFDRGWRFLRGLQVWNGSGLVQNPCDVSNFLHAVAVRTLLASGSDPESVGPGTLTLLHQARSSGGWSAGGLLPTDFLTTAMALDALSLAGDDPIETSWARRRAVMLMLRSQRPDGGWPLFADVRRWSGIALAVRGSAGALSSSVDVTATVLHTLMYSGVQEIDVGPAVMSGASCLLRRQQADGLWPAGAFGSALFSTSRAVEVLLALPGDRIRGAAARAVMALESRQRDDGGWSKGTDGRSSPHCTAWVLRALSGWRSVSADCLSQARKFLGGSLDSSELLWTTGRAALPLPLSERPVAIPELTTLWALEALIPAGLPTRPRATWPLRPRSIFHRSRGGTA